MLLIQGKKYTYIFTLVVSDFKRSELNELSQDKTAQIYFSLFMSCCLCSGGALVFDEADIELQAENILITDGGRLQVGQEGAPFQHKAIITLHGQLRSPELPVYGAKTLAVRQGVLDLHGMNTHS